MLPRPVTVRLIPRDDTDIVCLRVLGTTVGVETLGPAVRDTVVGQWSRCVVDPPASPVPTMLAVGSSLALPPAFSRRLVHDVSELAVEALAGRAVLLHAAGLSTDDGVVVALVATSGTGKTTATRALARDGLGYVTDETVAVLDDLTVPTFAKPLSVITDPSAPEEKEQLSPDALDLARPVGGPLRLGGIVLLDRDPTHRGAPRSEPLALLDAVQELVGHTSHLVRLPRPLVRLAEVVAAVGGAWRTTYAEASALRDVMHERATAGGLAGDGVGARPGAVPDDWCAVDLGRPASSHEGGDRGDARGVGPARRGTVLRRGPVADGIRQCDEALLLLGHQPVRLGPLALTLWDAAATGATTDTLVEAARHDHGEHPDAAALVTDAVEQLCAAGVLVRD